MIAEIFPSEAHGTVAAPPSKSMAHRLLLAAGLAEGRSVITNLAQSSDVAATVDCLNALGATVQIHGDTATVTGFDPTRRASAATLPCRESGSTLRFLLPIGLLSEAPVTLTGTQKLLSRPLSIYADLCRANGFLFEQTETSVTVRGPLTGGTFLFSGGVSSQFATGLLYALPLCREDSEIRLLPPVESRSYIDLTLSALKAFGVEAGWAEETTLRIPGGQRFSPQKTEVEGDWSNAAFLEGLNLLGGNVTVTGLDESSLQGDRVYRAHFAALQSGSPVIDLSDCPDLGPVLFALAGALHGASFTGVERLRLKESDRVAAMREELWKFGVRTEADAHTLTVYPGLSAPTARLSGHNDHRVVMADALLCAAVGGSIAGEEAVAKSFPDFFDRYRSLGVRINELDQQQ